MGDIYVKQTSNNSPPPSLPVPNSTKSFWHTQPVLQGHRTTHDLPNHARFVIVGSGITGTSAAWYLDKLYSEKCVVLEAREACWGATGRNGGHLQPRLKSDSPESFFFELANCAEVASIVESHRIDCELRQVPACHSYWTEASWQETSTAFTRLSKVSPELDKHINVASKEELEAAKVRAELASGGLLVKDAASLWPYKYVTSLLKLLIDKEAVNLQTNTPVTELKPISSSQQGGSWQVITPRGSIEAEHVLLATNAYTPYLLKEFTNLIGPIHETMTAIIPPPSLSKDRLPNTYGFAKLDNLSGSAYLIHRAPERGGQLMLGGGTNSFDYNDAEMNKENVEYLKGVLPRTMSLGESVDKEKKLEMEMAWSGIWAMSRDMAPWVGPVPDVEGLWVCAGYSGHGMPNATLCARAAVKMMMGDDNEALKELPRDFLVTKKRMNDAEAIAASGKGMEKPWI